MGRGQDYFQPKRFLWPKRFVGRDWPGRGCVAGPRRFGLIVQLEALPSLDRKNLPSSLLSAWPFELNLKEERFARPESHPGEALRWERLASRPPGKLGPEHRTPAPSPISPPFLLEALRVEKEQSSKKGGALRSSRPPGSAPLFYVCQGQAPRRLLAKRFVAPTRRQWRGALRSNHQAGSACL